MRRRARSRYYTIDAENEDDFLKEYENMRKSRFSKSEFDDKEEDEEKAKEINEEKDQLSLKKTRNYINHNNFEEEGEYSGLGAMKDIDEEDEEDDLAQTYEDDEILKESEDDIFTKDNNEERGLEILCYYLKNSVIAQTKEKTMNYKNFIFYRNKNYIGALSWNAIYDLNIRDLVNNILTENDNEYIMSNGENNNSLKDYILQNIESDKNLKIMIMSNNKSTKNSFIEKFFELGKNNKDKLMDDPFAIRKKQIKLFNKNISLTVFDTSDEFHNNSTSFVYYDLVSAFFIFIEASSHNVKAYLDFIYKRLNKFISNRTFVIFGINMLFNEDSTIDGNNLRDYANEKNIMFIPIKMNDFDLKNSLILNLFNLILIKGIDNKIGKESLSKESKDKKLEGFENKLTLELNDSNKKKDIYDITKMNIPNNLGYKRMYRIKHINAFDISNNYFPKYKRKISVDI